MAKGKFIVIEGGEGSGKDTQIELLKKHFGETDFVFTREPGGTPLGQVLRGILLEGAGGGVEPLAETFLFMADRAQHVARVIEPALAAGKTVVSNRGWPSFLAYQIYGRQQEEWLELAQEMVQKVFVRCPIDLVVVLDVSPEAGFARVREAGRHLDFIESAGSHVHERIRQAFLDIATRLPQAVVVDADRPIEEVWRDVKAAVESTL